MNSNLSLRTTVLVTAILISGVLAPYTVFASPIFETGTVNSGVMFESRFNPEHSISAPPMGWAAKILEVDVNVFDGATLQEVYISFENPAVGFDSFLAYTTDVTQHPIDKLPYYLGTTNSSQIVKLNKNNAGSDCDAAFKPKVAVTTSHVFVTWLDQKDSDCDTFIEVDRIAAIAIDKSKFVDLTGGMVFFDPVTTSPAYFKHTSDGSFYGEFNYNIAAHGTDAYIVWENSTSVNYIPLVAQLMLMELMMVLALEPM